MGLPPIISLLTAMFPILRRGRLPADEFPAAERALVDVATIEAVRDLLKNVRRVSLFDIFVFPTIRLRNPKQPGCLARRITYCMGEKHALVGPKPELFGRIPLVAIMEMCGKALRSGEKIHIRGYKARGDVII